MCLLGSCRSWRGGVDGYIVLYIVMLNSYRGGRERRLMITWKSKDEGKELLRAQCLFTSVQLLSPVQLCNPMDCSTPGLPVHHQLPEFTQTHVYWVGDAIQPSHPLSSPSSLTPNLSQHQGLFQRVSSSHQVGKVLEFQLQHQSFQWIFRTDFL